MAANEPMSRDEVASIVEDDKAYFVHPWTLFDSFQQEGCLPVTRGEGICIYDGDGNRYIDGAAGLWCMNIGYGREEIANAVSDQIMELAFFSTFVNSTNVPAVRLAKKLAEIAPGSLNRVMFTTGGSTAIDSAFRLIQYYQNCRGKPEKKHIIAREESYHGSTYAAMSIGGKKADHPPEFTYIEDTIHHVSHPNQYRRAAAMVDVPDDELVDALVREFEEAIAALGGADHVAAFFAEPVQGAGGVIPPPDGYLPRIASICQQNDILFVADEVVTGFGRLGHWFASQDVFGVSPDIITCAKGITSGYIPLGATIFSDEIYEVISETGHGRCFSNGFTYSGHPVACIAALKNIEIIEDENLLESVREIGPYFMQRLSELLELAVVGDVRGHHLMAAVEIVEDKASKVPFAAELNVADLIDQEAMKRGLIIRPIDNFLVMSPPLVIDRADVDTIVSILRESIQAVQNQLQLPASGVAS